MRKRFKDLSDRQCRHVISQDLLQYEFLNTNQSHADNSLLIDNIVNDENHMNVDNQPCAEDSSVSEKSLDVNQIGVIDMEIVEPEICKEEQDPEDLKSFLATWASDYGLTHSQLKPLLVKLREHECFEEKIPKDPRTLLKTPRGKTIVQTVRPGEYYHFGLKSGIEEVLSKHKNHSLTSVRVKIGIDGVQLTKSSTSQFWPILASVEPFSDIFLVGVYFGYEKPTFEEEFLEEFLAETENLCNNGIQFGETNLPCEIYCVICDAPAKSFILNVKGHTAYCCCTKCVIKGKWSSRRVCFPHKGKFYTKRSDAGIQNRIYNRHQLGFCCLSRIPNFDLIRNIPLDYMHLVCLGCMKRLLSFWLVVRSKHRLPKWQINKISKRLLTVKKYTPKEFARKPRSLKVLKFWKATEYRQFLLYTGTMVLCGILPKKLYQHFNTLHVAIRILCNETFVKNENYLNFAEELLSHFVWCLTTLYGSFSVSYNMHGLLHLVDDVRLFGTLDNFSAFKFESYMQQLKKWMRKGDKPLQQLVRRYLEFKEKSYKLAKSPEMDIKINCRSEHYNGPLPEGCCNPQYRKLSIAGLALNVSRTSDSCFGLTTQQIVLIFNIAHSSDSNEIVIIGRRFEDVNNLYTKPCCSSIVNEFVVKDLSDLQLWPLKCLEKKYFIVPSKKDEYVVSSLLHID